MAITVDVEVAMFYRIPARIGLNCQLARGIEQVSKTRIRSLKTIPTAATAACFDPLWDLPLSNMYTRTSSRRKRSTALRGRAGGIIIYQLLKQFSISR